MAPVKEPKWRVKGMENVSAPVHASLPRRQREGRSLGSQDFPRRSSAGEGDRIGSQATRRRLGPALVH